MINGAGGVIDLENEQLMVPGGALSHDTMICFSRDDPDKLRESVECSHWSGMLNLISVIKIQCQPPVIQFNKPVLVTVPLPEELWNKPFLQLRLFQSNYMSNWQDITNEPHSKVEVVGAANSRVQIKTNYTGWVKVAHIDFDVNNVMQMAIRSVLVAEPLVVTINVFGCIFPDNHAQVVAFLKSSSSSEDNSTQQKVRAPPGFVPIAFPRTIKVHVGQRLRLELQGNDFESCSGPSTEFTVDDPLNQIVEKTVKMDSTKMLRGQLIISSYCNSPKGWKKLEDIDLVTGTHSAKNGYSH